MRAPSGTSCRRLLGAAAVAGVATALAIGPSASAHRGKPPAAQHVLLLSVDGLHQSDLELVRRGSTRPRRWRALVRHGVEFTHARTPVPVRLVPGHGRAGHRRQPRHHRRLLRRHLEPRAAARPARPTAPAHARAPRSPTSSSSTKNLHSLDAGQGLTGLPGTHPADDRRPGRRDRPGAAAGRPAAPASRSTRTSYLRVNTIFEVRAAHGLRTAWSDKHPAYEILNGPSGTGVPGPLHPGDQQRGADRPARATTGPPTTR